MKACVKIVVCLGLILHTAFSSANIRHLRSARNGPNRIFGGVDAEEGEFPWQVSIQDRGHYHLCGGVIIGEYYVLTAAHCSQFDDSFYLIKAGSVNRSNPLSQHDVTAKYIYAGFQTTEFGSTSNDLAIMRVSPPFVFDTWTGAARLSPVRLPRQCVPTPQGSFVTVTGWGLTEDWNGSPEILRKVSMPITNIEECNAAYEVIGGVAEGSLCAGLEEGGKDSCMGDSGGPMVFDNELRGLVSWGLSECAYPGYPGVYTDVAHFRSWIRRVTGI